VSQPCRRSADRAWLRSLDEGLGVVGVSRYAAAAAVPDQRAEPRLNALDLIDHLIQGVDGDLSDDDVEAVQSCEVANTRIPPGRVTSSSTI
jgi:hypothetical protein